LAISAVIRRASSRVSSWCLETDQNGPGHILTQFAVPKADIAERDQDVR
jgi:hypothetical protein